jgi:uncharacterized protein (TIGR02466 family)
MYRFEIKTENQVSLGEVTSWFPKSILHSKNLLDSEYLNTLKNQALSYIDFDSQRTGMLNVDSTHSTNNIVNDEKFSKLFDAILVRTISFASLLGFSKDQVERLEYFNAWVNRAECGDFNFPHVHPGADFSGVFYLQSDKDCSITFYDNIYNGLEPPNEFNDLSYEYTRFQCLENSLLLFKSNLLHANEYQLGKEKISLSFNLKFR